MYQLLILNSTRRVVFSASQAFTDQQGSVNTILRKAENREEWRKLVVKSTVVP